MARIRTIKPEFADDKKLAGVSRDARLSYILIWNHSDDYGATKGDPIWLKNRIYPYDSIKIEKFEGWLNELVEIKRLFPYTHHGETYYFMPYFLIHQKIDRPSRSRYPTAPFETFAEFLRDNIDGLPTIQRVLDESSPIIQRLLDDVVHSKECIVHSQSKESESEAAPPDSPPSVNFDQEIKKLVELYHEKCLGLPKVQDIKPSQPRYKAAKLRLQEHTDQKFWNDYLDSIAASAFLNGESDRGWIANFAWIVNPTNMQKILEGEYVNRDGKQNGPTPAQTSEMGFRGKQHNLTFQMWCLFFS